MAPWIHFEAGGMIKGLGKSKVATILLDLDYGELQQPLNQFNGLHMDRIGARHLVKSFNKVSDRPIKETVVEKSFEAFWPELEKAYKSLFPHIVDLDGDEQKSMYVVPSPQSPSVHEKLPANPGKRRKRQKHAPVQSIQKDQLYLFGTSDPNSNAAPTSN